MVDDRLSIHFPPHVSSVFVNRFFFFYVVRLLQYLYDTKQLCDITLRVEGEVFRAHKAVLACSESFLGALMTSGMRERDQEVIDLKDISAHDVSGQKLELSCCLWGFVLHVKR